METAALEAGLVSGANTGLALYSPGAVARMCDSGLGAASDTLGWHDARQRAIPKLRPRGPGVTMWSERQMPCRRADCDSAHGTGEISAVLARLGSS